MNPTRRLIVTADDFGCSPEVNRAVAVAYREGILRFASLLVRGSAAAEAVRLARDNPGLGVGLHLDLCRDRPAAHGWRFFFDRKLRAWLEGEIEGQIRTCLSWGITPTHVDGHLNIHVHPVVFPLLARLAARHGIGRIRLTGGELGLSLGYDLEGAVSGLVQGGVFGALRRYLRRRGHGLEIPDRTLGLLRSGRMTEDYLLWIIPRLPPGLTEIYCHPSSQADSEAIAGPTATHQSLTELRALTSPKVRAAVEAAGVGLVEAPPARAVGG